MSSNVSREDRVSLEVLKEVVKVPNAETLGSIPVNWPKSRVLRPKPTQRDSHRDTLCVTLLWNRIVTPYVSLHEKPGLV